MPPEQQAGFSVVRWRPGRSPRCFDQGRDDQPRGIGCAVVSALPHEAKSEEGKAQTPSNLLSLSRRSRRRPWTSNGATEIRSPATASSSRSSTTATFTSSASAAATRLAVVAF